MIKRQISILFCHHSPCFNHVLIYSIVWANLEKFQYIFRFKCIIQLSIYLHLPPDGFFKDKYYAKTFFKSKLNLLIFFPSKNYFNSSTLNIFLALSVDSRIPGVSLAFGSTSMQTCTVHRAPCTRYQYQGSIVAAGDGRRLTNASTSVSANYQRPQLKAR